MIVGMSMFEGLGTSFRTRLFLPRWNLVKQRLSTVEFHCIPALQVRVIIDKVDADRRVVGIEDAAFVVETFVSVDEFKRLSIGEKNDFVLDTIFESIKAAYAHFESTPPPEIDQIWQEARLLAKPTKAEPAR
jgi:hypothetical protein